jgi:hypothetical protein
MSSLLACSAETVSIVGKETARLSRNDPPLKKALEQARECFGGDERSKEERGKPGGGAGSHSHLRIMQEELSGSPKFSSQHAPQPATARNSSAVALGVSSQDQSGPEQQGGGQGSNEDSIR